MLSGWPDADMLPHTRYPLGVNATPPFSKTSFSEKMQPGIF
jgi:hypothetical protein